MTALVAWVVRASAQVSRLPSPLTAFPRPSMVPAMYTAHNAFFGICREIIRP